MMKKQLDDVEAERAWVRQNIKDYSEQRYLAERQKLVEIWRAAFPEAANESSSVHKPLLLLESRTKTLPGEPDEVWANDTYQVTVRRHEKDPVFGSRGGMIQLGINALDGTARHDWREFQAIKNQLAGSECEGFELYPAESRLMDPSNYYSLWCFPGLTKIRVGKPDRRVFDADEAYAPQRALPPA
jgi:hypothetical protein